MAHRTGHLAILRSGTASLVLLTATAALPGGETLLTDHFDTAEVGETAAAAGWTLKNDRGKSEWRIGEAGVCRVHHTTVAYSQDSISRKIDLPPRFYLDFEAKFSEHAGFSLVAAPGRAATAFYGAGKAVLWKLMPQQGRGWRTVPKGVSAGQWHRFRILVDTERKLQEYYIDRMDEPALRETGLDVRLNSDRERSPLNTIEFRDYGLVQQAAVNEFRNVSLVALKPDERPPDDSAANRFESARTGPTPAQFWQRPGRGKAAPPAEPVRVSEHVQLFVDDYLIASAENLRRRLNKPVPHPENPILSGDQPWENGQLAFPSVHFIDGEFRMWYLGWGNVYPSRAGEVSIADSSFLCYATSRDGVHWQKPDLGHVEFRGSRDNNIVLRHEGSHFDSFSVFHHPGEAYPFKMLAYQGRWPYQEPLIRAKGYSFRIREHGHFPFRSRDGFHWEYIQDEPEPVWGFDRSSAGYDSRRGKYLGFWKTSRQGVRSRMYAESDDLVHWTAPEPSLTPGWIEDPDNPVDPPGTQFYGMYAFNYGDQYLGLLEILNDFTSRMHFQLISSRDLKTWDRLSAPEGFIDHGPDGAWNSGLLMMANSPPVLRDGKLWFYYDGADFDHSGGDRTGKTRRIGVSTLPEDRFAALYPDDRSQPATLTSVPLVLDGTSLHVNAQATNGTVQVELLDTGGRVLPGFSREDCELLSGRDVLDHRVAFKGDKPLPDGAVRVRFVLFEAELFAFRVR